MAKVSANDRPKILASARSEFLDKSFQKTTTKAIAKLAGVSSSKLYHYFSGKEDIFATMVSSLALDLERQSSRTQLFTTVLKHEPHQEQIEKIVKFLVDKREDLHLLLNRAQGSKLEDFEKNLTQKFGEMSEHLLEDTALHSKLNFNLSRQIFTQALTAMAFYLIKEYLEHQLTKDQLIELVSAWMHFQARGFELHK